MKTSSLAAAKAHLSALVDDAEHHGKATIILRHGTPSAAIVPLAMALPKPSGRRSSSEARKILDAFCSLGEPGPGAVADLLANRR